MRNNFFNNLYGERIAEKYGLTGSCNIVRIFLTSTQKEELLNHIYFTDGKVFTNIAKSKFFYLIRNNNARFELFCCTEDPKIPICVEMLNDKKFLHVQIEERYLIRFLMIITPLKVVESNEA